MWGIMAKPRNVIAPVNDLSVFYVTSLKQPPVEFETHWLGGGISNAKTV